MIFVRPLGAALAALSLAALPLVVGAASPQPCAAPSERASTWRDDPAWYDGKAEKCVYRAVRTIYGLPREHEARAYTNKQHMDPRTTTKSVDSSGVAVFKHHWSRRVPTENYDYDFSTASFLEVDGLAPFKLAIGTQEDCGASYKQVTRRGGKLAVLEATYFPGGGLRELELPAGTEFRDSLSLRLRDYPFDAPRDLQLSLVQRQEDPRSRPWEPRRLLVRSAGVEDLVVPAGSFRAHRLELVDPQGSAVLERFWFAADGSAPLLHVLLRWEGEDGASAELVSQERTAYWERPTAR